MMTVVNSMAMFSRLGKMSENDVVLNTAFAVSGAWLLGDHFCFVAQVEPGLLMPVFISKLVASLASLCFCAFSFYYANNIKWLGQLIKKVELN